jgi:hypothetical protein
VYVSGKDVLRFIYRKQDTQHFTKFKCLLSTKPSSTRWHMDIPLLCWSVGNLYARSWETVAHGTNFLSTQACFMLCHFFFVWTLILLEVKNSKETFILRQYSIGWIDITTVNFTSTSVNEILFTAVLCNFCLFFWCNTITVQNVIFSLNQFYLNETEKQY